MLENFIEKAKKIHGERYSYEFSLITKKGNKSYINILCKIHGEFTQRTDGHLSGYNCRKCSNKLIAENHILTNEEFIKRSNIIHNNKYNYDLANYTDSRNKVIIICPIHGEFLQVAGTHIHGKGCTNCGKVTKRLKQFFTIEEFINKANEIHNFKYDYSLVEYNGYQSKVVIICPVHGQFLQTPDVHTNQKSACKLCNERNMRRKSHFIKYSKNNQATFYIIKCWNENEEFYKIGITTMTVKRRYKNMPYKYQIIYLKKDNPEYIWELEKCLLMTFKNFKYIPKLHFGGKTECFNLNLSIEKIIT